MGARVTGRVRAERHGHVAIVTIDHPEKHNALSEQMRTALAESLEDVDVDPQVRCIILTGAGDRAFVAGGDIAELARRTLSQQRAVMAGGSVFEAVRQVRTPLIAAINGVCLGGGLEIACGCDLRIASNTAKFGQTEINIGLIPGGGGTQMLPRIIGQAQALRLAMLGDVISAEEALRIGLVHEVVDLASLMGRAEEIADSIAARSPLAVRSAKQAVRSAFDLPFEEGRRLEVSLFEGCFDSPDRVEGVNAFLERRTPVYRDE